MRFRGRDWDGWLSEETASGKGAPAARNALGEVLLRVPNRSRKRLGDVGGCAAAAVPLVGDAYGSVVPVELQRLASRRPPARFEVFAFADADPCGKLSVEELLRGAYASLVEGGLFVALVPARRPRGLVPLAAGPRPLEHELDLNYRLERAGFRGVRLCRFTAAVAEESDVILTLAARRIAN